MTIVFYGSMGYLITSYSQVYSFLFFFKSALEKFITMPLFFHIMQNLEMKSMISWSWNQHGGSDPSVNSQGQPGPDLVCSVEMGAVILMLFVSKNLVGEVLLENPHCHI